MCMFYYKRNKHNKHLTSQVCCFCSLSLPMSVFELYRDDSWRYLQGTRNRHFDFQSMVFGDKNLVDYLSLICQKFIILWMCEDGKGQARQKWLGGRKMVTIYRSIN